MADVIFDKRKSSNKSRILKWYDAMHRFQQTNELDQAINIAIAGLMIVITFTIAAQFIISRPVVTYNTAANCTKAVHVNDTHSKNKFLHKVKTELQNACDEYNDVNIGTQVYVNNQSAALNIFYLCDTKEHFVNPVVVKTGTNAGKCSESYGNAKKTKKRQFPVVLRDTKSGKSKTFYTLKDSCAIHSAIERLLCVW